MLYLHEYLELSVQVGFSARLGLLLCFPGLPATFPSQQTFVRAWFGSQLLVFMPNGDKGCTFKMLRTVVFMNPPTLHMFLNTTHKWSRSRLSRAPVGTERALKNSCACLYRCRVSAGEGGGTTCYAASIALIE